MYYAHSSQLLGLGIIIIMDCKNVSAKIWNETFGETVKMEMMNWCLGRDTKGRSKGEIKLVC